MKGSINMKKFKSLVGEFTAVTAAFAVVYLTQGTSLDDLSRWGIGLITFVAVRLLSVALMRSTNKREAERSPAP